ncbi:hypothetical protein BP6252_13166 [Coleophoma cylindrospora]|uniref:Rhodopsin domain-containing protein n=1 Tax=Coleophoma cylindrospora TaxID=1849047 RepID=A0A3D8QAJ3_9HELO|nr:hypothetical protein BP6252_13166 [Coleophoma cylindrospora]
MTALNHAVIVPRVDLTANNAPRIIIINAIFTGVALLVIIARMYVRIAMLKTVGADDHVIMSSMALGVGVLICVIGECYWGKGKHVLAILPQNMVKLLHWQFFHSILVTIGISLVKISLASFLSRLVTNKIIKRFLIGAIIFLVLFTISSAGTIIFSCIPISATWDPAAAPNAKCFSRTTFTDIGLFNSIVNIFTDVIFACLPIPIVWNLQLNTRTRVTLVGVLSLGFFACACAIVKTVLQFHFYSNTDFTFTDSYFIWNNIELSVGIIGASLPALRPLFASLLESTKDFATRRTGLGSSSNAHRRYYAHIDRIGMESMPRTKNTANNYNVTVSSRSALGERGSEEDMTGAWHGHNSSEDKLPLPRAADVGSGNPGIIKTIDVRIS